MGDAQFASKGMMYTFDALQFYASWLRSIRDEQLKTCHATAVLPNKGPCDQTALHLVNGSLPDTTPFSNQAGPMFPGSVVWQSAYVIIVRRLWHHFGASAAHVLRDHYSALQQFMGYLRRIADNRSGLVLTGGMGEWAPPQPQENNKNRITPAESVSAFYGLLDLKYMSEIAEALGHTDDAAAYEQRFVTGRAFYHATFALRGDMSDVQPEWCFYAGCTQTAHLMPLVLDGMMAQTRANVIGGLVALIANGDPTMVGDPSSSGPIPAMHLSVGTVGANWVFDVLTRVGADDLLLSVMLQDSYPSYGLFVASSIDAPPRPGTMFPQRGSSSLWETWEGQVSERWQ
jgi:hypothetical protein